MANKRVSQLVELTATEVSKDDLFLIIDTSLLESKKIPVSQLASFLSVSGSLIASHASISDLANFVLGSNVSGPVSNASFASSAGTAISANSSDTSTSASYAKTSSWAINSINGGSTLVTGDLYPITSSWSLNSLTSIFSGTSSVLLYIPGVSKNTASYAIKAQTVDNVISSSYSIKASSADTSDTANTSILSNTTNFLNFSPNNGTASYALTAGSFNNSFRIYGMYLATTQSLFNSQLDDVYVNSSTNTNITTSIEVMGTVVIPFTSSIIVNEILSLVIKDRNSGTETIIDSTPIYFNLSPIAGNWDTFASGTIKIPYSMIGSDGLFGHYEIFVTASSNNIYIEPNRINRFNISSFSDNLSVNSGEPLEFSVNPISSLILFTSSLGGPFLDTTYNMVHTTGSSNIFEINCNNLSLTSVKYLWTLPNLITASFSLNPSLSNIGGFQNSLKYLDCSDCIIQNLVDLSSIWMSYLKCNNNFLSNLPTLPSTMSYINCSNNFISNLPIQLPYSLSYFYCDGNKINSVSSLPDTIISMSFSNNLLLSFWGAVLPSNLVYINFNNSPIQSLTILPPNTKYIHTSNCSLTLTAMDNICSQSLVNAINNAVYTGSIDITGNGTPNTSSVNNYIVPLIGTYNWSVLTD